MHKYLENLLHKGTISSNKEFRIFWNFHDEEVTDLFHPDQKSLRIYLIQGYAEICVDYMPDYSKSKNAFSCFSRVNTETPILFYNYYDNCFSSYKQLQYDYAKEQFKYYNLLLCKQMISVEELNKHCFNNILFAEGKCCSDFLTKGYITLKTFTHGTKTLSLNCYFDVVEAVSDNPILKVTRLKLQ